MWQGGDVWSQVDRDELLEASGWDPFVRFATSSELLAVAGEAGWACVTPWRPGGRHWGGAAMVAPDAPRSAESEALELLVELAGGRGRSVEWFSTADGRVLSLPEGLRGNSSGRWDFMITHPPPPQGPAGGMPFPSGDAVVPGLELVELDDRLDADRIGAFGRTHNTAFEGFPGLGLATLWLGLRDPAGELLAVGAVHELASGIPHLSGIVVHSGHRGKGLGRWVTEELTRRAVEEAGVSTLGVYSDNLAAQRLYSELGYVTVHRFHTRNILPGQEQGGQDVPT